MAANEEHKDPRALSPENKIYNSNYMPFGPFARTRQNDSDYDEQDHFYN
jgi:hypothetical protein